MFRTHDDEGRRPHGSRFTGLQTDRPVSGVGRRCARLAGALAVSFTAMVVIGSASTVSGATVPVSRGSVPLVTAAHGSIAALADESTAGRSMAGTAVRARSAVVSRPHTDPTCTFNGVTDIVPNVAPGSLITIACTGWTPGDQVAAGELSPLYLVTGSANDLDLPGQSFTADGSGNLQATFVVPNPFVAADPAAVCPPTATQVAQGYLRCGLVVVDGAGNGALAALDYASAPVPPPVVTTAVGMAATPDGGGYWLAWTNGNVTVHGDAQSYGNASQLHLNQPITHIVATPDGKGYWLVAADGGTFTFGDAGFYGSMGGRPLNAPVVDIAPTSDGKGYWLVGSDGGIFSFGDATFHGSTGALVLNKPVVGISADDATGGYWLVATDGGIFAFDAPFFGSTGSLHLNKPINGMAATANDRGYWLVASDGGIFAGGNAAFHGSTGALTLNKPVVGMAADANTGGYWLVAADGGIFAFDAPFYGAG